MAFAWHFAVPTVASTEATALSPVVTVFAVNSTEGPVPEPISGPPEMAAQVAPSLITTGLFAASHVETQNFALEPFFITTRSGVTWQVATVEAAGAATHFPLRQVPVSPQSRSAEHRAASHLPSSHWQPSAPAQKSSANWPRTEAVHCSLLRHAGSHLDFVVLQKNSCGSGQSSLSRQPTSPASTPPSAFGLVVHAIGANEAASSAVRSAFRVVIVVRSPSGGQPKRAALSRLPPDMSTSGERAFLKHFGLL
jgi:hypothetical protein